MSELPDYMLQKERTPDQDFAPEESLYRRVPHESWDEDDIELDVIEFPDMSVTREKYGSPQSARWRGDRKVDWGVVGFQVKDIPKEIPYQGAVIYRMRPVHAPQRRNYPHSEVQVFEAKWERPDQEIHIDKRLVPGVPLDAQQEFRELLRRKCRIVLRPGEKIEEN